eukprot:Blabericola_migrator_1__8776@NODE_4624_length_1055_cov_2_849190_g2875_i0_p1_GENE_NODE_4624_length_1055_cov_2_849190_g2875_i0NODE_4624_length_1055_cov_2_849190_g2875_i0_p1_ORF_typecomplete_len147_score10_55_NODE_4624_length_1055_cov_2_849190_g2875_i042482
MAPPTNLVMLLLDRKTKVDYFKNLKLPMTCCMTLASRHCSAKAPSKSKVSLVIAVQTNANYVRVVPSRPTFHSSVGRLGILGLLHIPCLRRCQAIKHRVWGNPEQRVPNLKRQVDGDLDETLMLSQPRTAFEDLHMSWSHQQILAL